MIIFDEVKNSLSSQALKVVVKKGNFAAEKKKSLYTERKIQ